MRIIAYIKLRTHKEYCQLIMIYVDETLFHSELDGKAHTMLADNASITRVWERCGAEIVYCTRTKGQQADATAAVLRRYGFAGSTLYYREDEQSYEDVLTELRPDILIETGYEMIGTVWGNCLNLVNMSMENRVYHLSVKKGKGINHLSGFVTGLINISRTLFDNHINVSRAGW